MTTQKQPNVSTQDFLIPPMSNRTVWLIRFTLLALLTLWVAGILYFHGQVEEARARAAQSRIEAQRRNEHLRRGASYRQQLREQNQTSRVRNAVDGR